MKHPKDSRTLAVNKWIVTGAAILAAIPDIYYTPSVGEAVNLLPQRYRVVIGAVVAAVAALNIHLRYKTSEPLERKSKSSKGEK